MRCDNCGWMNPEGVECCQKCNQKLKTAHVEEPTVVRAPKPEPAQVSAPAVINCDKCGREYSLQIPACPHCGFSNPKFKESPEPVAPKAFDMNKTVAFGAGMAAPQPAAPVEMPQIAEMDKSELKKTMVAGRETPAAPPVPPAMPPFATQDKSELKKTMVAGRETPSAPQMSPVEAPQFTPPVIEQSELKKTMAAGDLASFQIPGHVAPKVADADLQHTVIDAPAVDAAFEYSLQSMDHGAQSVVSLTITASSDICLKAGDIILIAGMRYRVI